MERPWDCLKAFWRFYTRLMIILSIIFMLVVWTVGSYQAGQILGLDDLIPTADRWIGKH
jgi:hypothetical protein